MSVKLVSPRILLEFARAPEDILITYELGLVGLYAGVSKQFHQHKVISLVEGDYRHIGRAGTLGIKVAFRRFTARYIDVFVANNTPARDYLIRTLNVPEKKIIVGWWLAGMPADLAARPGRKRVQADLAWEHSAPVLLAAYERLWQTPGGAYAIALEQRSADRSSASRTSP